MPQLTVRRLYSTPLIVLAAGLPLSCWAQQHGQRTFASAEEASSALAAAVQGNDEKALIDLLGADSRPIVSSGDKAEDLRGRKEFTHAYQEMHRLVAEPDGTTTLYIGAKNWPTPIPLVHKPDAWYFDTDAAKKEILYRRVGRNEMSAARICRELVAAEMEYRQQSGEYARRIASAEGKHDGLYWHAGNTETQSPIGPLVASAVAKGDENDGIPLTPYRGYYFRILTAQGKTAPGGAKSYLVNGKMTEGFSFVAFPAEYRSSGVMTFMVGDDGVVYQKDLGAKTGVLATAMKEFDPDASWKRTENLSQN